MRIGAYEVEGELGRGGMGVVFRARGADGRAVALKLLPPAFSPLTRQRFDRERRLLASFTAEDGFVPLLDSGEENGRPYIVMPLLGGGTLRDRLTKGAQPVEQTIALAEALALALSRAHGRGVVHRDLKPENILYDDAGHPFVADLGVAKHFDVEAPGASRSVALSKSGDMLGSAGYMSPEQARDAPSAGPTADVFALGAILYECLAGRPAFEGATVFERLVKLTEHTPPRLAGARPETPAWLAELVERALSKDPGARHADGGAILAAIRARRNESSPSGGLGLPRGARKRALVAAPALLAVGALIAVLLRGPRAREDAARVATASGTIATTPSPGETLEGRLEAARALLRGAAPVTSASAPADLLAASSPGAASLRALAARRAIAYSLADAERLRSSFPGEPDASVLWAIPALGGAPEVRAAAESILERARDLELAPRLASAARFVDDDVDGAALSDLVASGRAPPSLVEPLRVLANAPRESVDLAVAPLTEAMVEHGLGLDERKRVTTNLVRSIGLDDHDALARIFPPRLLRARCLMDDVLAPDPVLRRAHAAESVAAETSEASLRLTATATAVGGYFWLWKHVQPFEEGDALERDGRALDRLRSELTGREAIARSALAGISSCQRRFIQFNVITGHGDRAAELARGLELAREARSADPEDVDAARDLLRFLLEQGSSDAASLESLVVPASDPRHTFEDTIVAAEVRRRSGDPAGALALLQGADPADLNYHRAPAVRALAYADLGRDDEALKESLIVPYLKDLPPLLTKLSRVPVAQYLVEHAKR